MTDTAASRLGWGALWFSFKGRATRFDYWVRYVVPFTVGGICAAFLDILLGTDDPQNGGLITWIYVVAVIWPAVAVGAKRCHDRDRSGWFLLIGFIPVVGTIWLLIELGFLRGSRGGNRFGADPLGGAPALAAEITT